MDFCFGFQGGGGTPPLPTTLEVGTTPITGGVAGRLLYEGVGNVLQESPLLSFDGSVLTVGNTQKILSSGLYPSLTFENSIAQNYKLEMNANTLYFSSGVNTHANLSLSGFAIGYGSTGASALVDIKAGGITNLDIVQRWRNFGNTANLGIVTGDGAFTFGTHTSPNTKLSVTGTTFGVYGSAATAFYADAGGANTRIGYDSTARSSTVGGLSIGVRGIADGGGATGVNRGVQGQASGSGTNYAGYFDAINGTTNYAIYVQRGNIAFQDANNVELGTTTGTKWGTAASQKQSWWGATAVVQQVLATGVGATSDDIIAMLQLYGICRQV